jgi:hypothetical protein
MKVKKGMASSVSLENTPHNRWVMVFIRGQSSVICPLE